MQEFEQLHTSSGKSKNLKFDGLLSKKIIPSAKTCTVDLSNSTFNYLCADSPDYLCHFWNYKSFFITQLLCIFLAQTLISTKVAQQSANFQTFPLLMLKITKFLMSLFKLKVSFSSKFRSFFSAMRDNTSVLFRLKLYMLFAKVAHQSANFQTCHCSR